MRGASLTIDAWIDMTNFDRNVIIEEIASRVKSHNENSFMGSDE